MAETKEKLFDQFPPVSTEEWKEKVVADLKGADFDKKLVWRTSEGFNVNPMYRAEDIADLKTTDSLPGEYPYIRGTRTDNNWLVRQDIQVTDIAAANAKAKDLLTKGVESLGFELPKDLVSVENLKALLQGIDVEKVELNFSTCMRHTLELAQAVAEALKASGADLTKAAGSIRFNPFRRMFTKGRDYANYAEVAVEIIAALKELPRYKALAVDGILLNNAGSFISQELGFALAWGNEWLAALTDKGLTVDEVAKRVKFNFGISSNYFMELAKFRAARMLWAQIVKQYNPACDCACKMKAHAETSSFNQTVFDAYVNLLRTQTETMSAALAGVDSITTTPFDKVYQEPDEFSERIARNQQLLLKEESHLNRITDPGAGSYYIETLTVSIAEQAWKLFLEVEDKGGFYQAVKEGFVQNQVNATAEARHGNMARRKEVLLGTNQFPNFTEVAADKVAAEEAHACCNGEHKCEPEFPVLNTKRAASDFEELRLATERSGKAPKVFMLTIGNLAMRLARSQFSANFFACAGYKIMDNLGFETVQAGVDAALEAKADIVVLCSSDDEYAQYAPEAFAALDGRALFVVAGAPACMDELKEKGITEFIHVRSNVLDTLRAFNEKLSI